MRKWTIVLLGSIAVAGFAVPVAAHDQYDRHASEHDRLEDRHDNVHDRLEDEHAYAHEEGLSRREHRQLHRELDYQHDRADYRIERQHRQEHRRDAWRSRYYDNWGY
ncbi:hypothetical protein J3E64_003700 [Sphingobium sp. OAS761]|uniref:hypothetical protein n=1 Tax=Sphingobium sp. OAS761 TaxID=2817901 RepID=UPI00209E1128|nr:hypothetical protein [Sphingobium sp. OAS761]MCP1471985.1 hypothetical protein [Sphingobium sp. OAS761]